ncbi:MAG: glycosyltransferase family 9 protein [Deltaproteobacteria bacterium]|nr:glycosyltransferase family 9 protein [Deltaproteobacteria bacterium]
MALKSVIFIRRDNIGDLVCTTPAIEAVRLKYPDIKIGVLVNSYNAEAILDNPDVDDVFIYEKGKHNASKGMIKVALNNFSLIRKVRAARFDAAIGCSYGYSARLARYTFLTGGKARIGYVHKFLSRSLYNVPVLEPQESIHEVEAMMNLVKPLGVDMTSIPRMSIIPDKAEQDKALNFLRGAGLKGNDRLVALHISSRKPQNRWPKERFKELAEKLQEELGLKIMLLWSPGSDRNPLHPGDDEKAEWLLSNMKEKPFAYRTTSLKELISAMSIANIAVCSDGGAMHIAAALGKPILTIWGSTDKKRWAPWGVPNIILQKDTKLAASVTVEEAFPAFMQLYNQTGAV